MGFKEIKYQRNSRVAIWDDKLRIVKPQELTFGWYESSNKTQYGLIGLWEDYKAGNEENLNPKLIRFISLPKKKSKSLPEQVNDAVNEALEKVYTDNVESQSKKEEEPARSIQVEYEEVGDPQSQEETPQPEQPKKGQDFSFLNTMKIGDLRQYAVGKGIVTPEEAKTYSNNIGKGQLRKLIIENS